MYEKSFAKTVYQFNSSLSEVEKGTVKKVYQAYLKGAFGRERSDILDTDTGRVVVDGISLSKLTCFTMQEQGVSGYTMALEKAFRTATYPFDFDGNKRESCNERLNPNRLAWMLGYVGVSPSEELTQALSGILESEYDSNSKVGLCCRLPFDLEAELKNIFVRLGLCKVYPFGRELYGKGLLDPVRATFVLSMVLLGAWQSEGEIGIPYPGSHAWAAYAKAHSELVTEMLADRPLTGQEREDKKHEILRSVWGSTEEQIMSLYRALNGLPHPRNSTPVSFITSPSKPLWFRLVVIYWFLVIAWLASLLGHHVNAAYIEPNLVLPVAH